MPSEISCQQLGFAYKDAPVLQDVSFELSAGKFVAVIGPNGGGKTTLLRLLMGFLNPTKGQVLIRGLPPKRNLRLFAYVPQNLKYDKKFPVSVLDVVLMGRLAQCPWYAPYRQLDIDAAYAALGQVGMANFAEQNFGSLSGGQSQRVLIARAFVSDPQILFLDEPTSNVDPQTEQEIYDILWELQQRQNLTIVMVTHHLQHIIHKVDHILCVQQTTSLLEPSQVCEHFALGVYHIPLLKKNTSLGQ